MIKIVSFSSNTHWTRVLDFPLHFVQRGTEYAGTTSVIRFRISCSVDRGVVDSLCLKFPLRNKSNGFRSGNRAGSSTESLYPMTCWRNVPRMYCVTHDTLCGGAPSCYNQIFRRSLKANPLKNRIVRPSVLTSIEDPVNVPS
ncbi:uncharacterized protein TNCV_444901 [Trichonephila clavipes]|nr:uncharacterized protein TNCV_444901 [Trichonephila clavipes]